MDDKERQHRPDFEMLYSGQSVREACEAAMTPLQRARARIADLQQNLGSDPTVAYCSDFVAAAAVLYRQDGQAYDALIRDLNVRKLRIADFEQRIRHYLRGRTVDTGGSRERRE